RLALSRGNERVQCFCKMQRTIDAVAGGPASAHAVLDCRRFSGSQRRKIMRLRGKIAIVVGAGQGPGEGIGNGRATPASRLAPRARKGHDAMLSAAITTSAGHGWRRRAVLHSLPPGGTRSGPPRSRFL